MSKYAFIIACLLLGMSPTHPHAAPAEQNALYAGIATCLGRFSAQMDHAHLMGTDAEPARTRHSDFSRLYAAMNGTRRLLGLRIAEKSRHAKLLHTATFNADPRRRRMAAQQAHNQIASCATILLS